MSFLPTTGSPDTVNLYGITAERNGNEAKVPEAGRTVSQPSDQPEEKGSSEVFWADSEMEYALAFTNNVLTPV